MPANLCPLTQGTQSLDWFRTKLVESCFSSSILSNYTLIRWIKPFFGVAVPLLIAPSMLPVLVRSRHGDQLDIRASNIPCPVTYSKRDCPMLHTAPVQSHAKARHLPPVREIGGNRFCVVASGLRWLGGVCVPMGCLRCEAKASSSDLSLLLPYKEFEQPAG